MPHTVAENLIRLQNATTAISNAIVEKGGTVASGDGLEEFATDIATIPSGGGGTGKNDVNFYDYDGTIVESYSANDFLALYAMPDNPTHDGLTSQGWNWSLTNAKAYVTAYGKLDIGQMYNTSDGALRLYIHLQEGRLSPTLGICVNGTVTVDWGDNSATETMTGSSTSTLVYLPHTYQTTGDYVISVLPSSGSEIGFSSRNSSSTILCKAENDSNSERYVYLDALYKVEIPSCITSIDNYVFRDCYNLVSITIPSSIMLINIGAFYNCSSLVSITIPSSITMINGYTFVYCYNLTSVTIPSNITSIGAYAFQNCYNLTSVTIPSSAKSISNYAFQNCYNLTSITIPNNVTSISSYAFSGCTSLTSITIPNNVTSISSYAFSGCTSLASVTIPSNVTGISDYVFQNCPALTSVTIPNSVTTIGSNAFKFCYGLGFLRFNSTTPPTVSSSNTWLGIPTDCMIYIPLDTYTAYTTATNYPSPSTYNYVEYTTYADGVTLPTTSQDETHTLTWYATIDDLKAETNPITVGNGNEVYAKAVAI